MDMLQRRERPHRPPSELPGRFAVRFIRDVEMPQRRERLTRIVPRRCDGDLSLYRASRTMRIVLRPSQTTAETRTLSTLAVPNYEDIASAFSCKVSSIISGGTAYRSWPMTVENSPKSSALRRVLNDSYPSARSRCDAAISDSASA